MKFIRLTEVFANGNKQPVILNCENIVSIKNQNVVMIRIFKLKMENIAPVIMNVEEALKYYGARGL